MQKIFNKEIKDEIKKSLKTDDINSINNKLKKFVTELEGKLEGKYFYDTGDKGIKSLTQISLTETILDSYFRKRVLLKGNRDDTKSSKKMSELSAGEKREALINLIYVFLKEPDQQRDTIVIIGIDEPENSLHTAICYEQFEKLKMISSNVQIFITTHWYGFLPIVDRGLVHFLRIEKKRDKNESAELVSSQKTEEVVLFDKADLYLYPYQTKNIPKDFSLKSTNDLVQSIFHSLKAKKPYNWLICEGVSDQIYLNYFLKDEVSNNNLRIIPVGGVELVKKFYKYLELPILENIEDKSAGKIFCLTDTDSNLRTSDIKQDDKLKHCLTIKRLAGDEKQYITSLIKFEIEESTSAIDIEKSLNPIVFSETLRILEADKKFLINENEIQNKDGNSTNKNLGTSNIGKYFQDENIKNNFATKYVEISCMDKYSDKKYIPSWIKEVKDFFKP